MRLIYHPEAEAELIEAAEFTEARASGLGDRFLREFDAAVAEVQASPDRWALVEGDLRCRTMGRILVVRHHSQHPDYWRHRLAE